MVFFALAPTVSTVTIGPMLMSRRHMLGLTAALTASPLWAAGAPIVFAASSLKPALDEISDQIAPMRLSFGGSGALARQILQGAPADVFISANPQWMDVVAQAGLVSEGPRPLLGNRLVLVGAAGAPEIDLSHWSGDGRIAMGFVDAVPSGQYGKAAFVSLGLWEGLMSQIVEVENVRAALALVVRGELPFAVVYATDAMSEPRVSVLHEFSEQTHPKITYPVAVLSDAGQPVIETLKSREAEAIFTRAGFELP